LGQALPMKNCHTGEIEKWYGSCTDIHEEMESKVALNRARQHMLTIFAHAQVTLFSVDRSRNLTLLEGSFLRDLFSRKDGTSIDQAHIPPHSAGEEFIGKNVYEVFQQIHPSNYPAQIPSSLAPIEDILNGKTTEGVHEHPVGKCPDAIDGSQALTNTLEGRWLRTRFVPLMEKKTGVDGSTEPFVDGVIAVSMDVTELKDRERDLRTKERENTELLANEAAAKEASRLKSQFLANVSIIPLANVLN
jgi:hypothetical protein